MITITQEGIAMARFKIEISRPYQILIWFGTIDIVAIAAFSITISVLTKNILLFLVSIIFITVIWLFIRVSLLNITITDKSINLNVARHKSRSITISDIFVVRLKSKKDYIVRGNPVFSKNVIAIEYLDKKKKKNSLYFSASRTDLECIIKLLVKYGCNYEVNNPT